MKPENSNVKKNFDSLVTMRALSLLFYNFTGDQIKELKKTREFAHVWDELEYKAKKKKWSSIPDYEFFSVFTKTSYETQSEIIRVAFERYEDESRKGIEYDQSFKEMMRDKIAETK